VNRLSQVCPPRRKAASCFDYPTVWLQADHPTKIQICIIVCDVTAGIVDRKTKVEGGTAVGWISAHQFKFLLGGVEDFDDEKSHPDRKKRTGEGQLFTRKVTPTEAMQYC
jgi:hypothetical protein